MSMFLGTATNSIGTLTFSITDEERTNLFCASQNYNYRRRSPNSIRDPNSFSSLWTRSGFACGDPVNGITYLTGQDISDNGMGYEPMQGGDTGSYRPYFLRGICTQAGAPIQGAVVEGYQTTGDIPTGSGVSKIDGSYEVPTPNSPGVNHYLLANYGPNTYTGTTVNTVQSAL